MEIINLLCKGLDALEDKLTQKAFDSEKELGGVYTDEETKVELHENIGYLRGMRDAYQSVRRSLEEIKFKQ